MRVKDKQAEDLLCSAGEKSNWSRAADHGNRLMARIGHLHP
jgi:hypothetical protein